MVDTRFTPSRFQFIHHAESPSNNASSTSTKKRPLNLLVVFPLVSRAANSTHGAKAGPVQNFVIHTWIHLAQKVADGAVLPPGSSIRTIGMVDSQHQCYPEFEKQSYAPHYKCTPILSRCHHPEYHIPTMDCIFNEAIRMARPSELILYANGDIVFALDGVQAIASIVSKLAALNHTGFLVTGRRTEVAEEEVPSTFSEQTYQRFLKHAQQQGVLYTPYGLDYFVLPAAAFPPGFPSFLVGRWRWDNALLGHFIYNDIPTGRSVAVRRAKETLELLFCIYVYILKDRPPIPFRLDSGCIGERSGHSCRHHEGLLPFAVQPSHGIRIQRRPCQGHMGR